MNYLRSLAFLLAISMLLGGCGNAEDDPNPQAQGITIDINGNSYFFKVARSFEDLDDDNALIDISFCLEEVCINSYGNSPKDAGFDEFSMQLFTGKTESEFLALSGQSLSFEEGQKVYLAFSAKQGDVELVLDADATTTADVTDVTKVDTDDDFINFTITGDFNATLVNDTTEESYQLSGSFDLPASLSID